jgi:CDP-L-myo-inositol myo-inositolphosphotransferase
MKLKVYEAVILAAGVGSRLKEYIGETPKPIVRVGGIPLICYSIASLLDIGVNKFHIVVNPFNKDSIEEVLVDTDLNFELIVNNSPERGNGYSLMIGMERVQGQYFYLSMSDHIYSYGIHRMMLNSEFADVVIAVDSKPILINVEEATKVFVDNYNVVNIGKKLKKYTHVDTGLFIISMNLYPYFLRLMEDREVLELSDMIRSAVQDNYNVTIFDVSGSAWMDIDTMEDIRRAESMREYLLSSLHTNLGHILKLFE